MSEDTGVRAALLQICSLITTRGQDLPLCAHGSSGCLQTVQACLSLQEGNSHARAAKGRDIIPSPSRSLANGRPLLLLPSLPGAILTTGGSLR